MRESFVTPSITKMLYGWSKWGRGNFGISREFTQEWSCQLCGEIQIVEFPQYFLPVDGLMRDFIRVCPFCWHDLKCADVKTLEELDSKIGIDSFKNETRLKLIEIETKLKTYLEDKL